MSQTQKNSTYRNIGGSVHDFSYRYKRPELEIRVQGRGGSTTTVVLNMREIASALHVDPMYVTTFIAIEIGTWGSYAANTGSALFKGRHDLECLDTLLEKFIAAFVLCPQCGLVEIQMLVKGTSLLYDCESCGAVGQLKSNHEVTTYIVKHPPDPHKNTKKEVNLFAVPVEVKQVDDEDVEWFTGTSKEAREARLREEFGNGNFEWRGVIKQDADDGDFFEIPEVENISSLNGYH